MNVALSLRSLRRSACPMAWLFVLLLLTVFAERRAAEWDFNDDTGVVVQNEEAVEGEELLTKLLLVNDVVLPVVPEAVGLQREQPTLLVVVAHSLLAVRGLESRAPPASSLAA